MACYTKSKAVITYTSVSIFRPEEDAQEIHAAMVGEGTRERVITDILGHRTNEQRQAISQAYHTRYHKNLIDELKKELKGDYEDLVVALMMPTAEFDAELIHKSIKGFGTNEDLLLEVLCTRTMEEMVKAKAAYQKLHKKDLQKAIECDTSGDFKKFCVKLITRGGVRDGDQVVDLNAAKKDAEALYSAGEGKFGTDEGIFITMLTTKSYAHMRAVFAEYRTKRGHDIEEAIKKEFSGDLKKGLLIMAEVIKNTPGYFAEKLHKSIPGKHEKDTIRIVVSRSEIDLEDIKEEYHRLYRKRLSDSVEEYAVGQMRVMLKSIIR